MVIIDFVNSSFAVLKYELYLTSKVALAAVVNFSTLTKGVFNYAFPKLNKGNMCILFLYNNPTPVAGRFRLIIASNRDEYYKRPTKHAHCWEEDNLIIGGRDLQPGNEGGSWLSISTRNGHIAALLNVMSTTEHPPHLLGRGNLVADFVRKDIGCKDYIKSFASNAKRYRPFNFLAIQLRAHITEMYAYSNVENSNMLKISDEYFAISNSTITSPFQKVIFGLSRFRNITESFSSTNNKEILTQELVKLLQWRESHFPDSVLSNINPQLSASTVKPYSSIFVEHPERSYGTRAQTVILVDDQGNIDFNEWSLAEPSANNMQWEDNYFKSQLQL